MYPSYSYPKHVFWGLVASGLLGLHRSFRLDGLACIHRLKPPLQVLGRENIPQSGPGLIIFNHYYRPGFNAWWTALAIAALVPEEIHFTMTGELTFPGKWYGPLGMAGSRWLLKRISHTYGFTTMPPMPPRQQDVQARALSVRAVLSFAQVHPQTLLALAPEGGDQPGGVLAWPPPGTGRFIHLLTSSGRPIYPVGIYEADGSFCLNFGPAFRLPVPPELSAAEKDRFAAGTSMQALSRLVPARLQGEFGPLVSQPNLQTPVRTE